MISLNVQWIPDTDRSGTYQWSGGDVSSRKVKTVTYFGTGEMRGQQQAKVITPPGSDYTDAYLSAFASKPIPTRHIHRLSTAVFANSAPIPLKPTTTPLTTSSSIKTSETRFININNIQTSDSFDKPIPSSSSRDFTYSPSSVPERSTAYEPFSSTQYSSPQSQTFTSSYSTLLRSPASTGSSTPTPSVDSQRAYTTFQTRSQPSQSTFPTVYRSDIAYENIYKPMPPYSIQAYPPSNTYTTSLSSLPTESTYKSYIPFQSAPLLSSYNINQGSTSERVVLPTSKIEKQIDRPETLLFQHDEDIRSSQIKKPSPMFSPSPESPVIREELKAEPERSHMEDLPTTSEPIQILENTLNKYDSLINQISEVLASVSPLSSTVSSMSPGKSALDYQLSSDSSPILQHKHIEPEPSQPSTTAKSSSTQRTKPSHLIRDDSYDKIVTAISDLDDELMSPSDIQKLPATIKEEIEEAKAPSLDESQLPPIMEEEKVESNISSLNEYQTQLETEQEKEEVKTPSISQEDKKETKISSLDEHQVPSVIEEKKEETKTTSTVEEITEQTKASPTNEQETPFVTEEEKEEAKTISTDEHQTPLITEEEKKEEIETASVGEQQTTSTIEEIKEETKASPTNEQETPFVTEEEKEEAKTISTDEHQTPSIILEEKKEEMKDVPVDEHQVPSITKEEKEEEMKTSLTDESQAPWITKEEKKETAISPTDEQQLALISEEGKVEMKTPLPEEHQVSSITEQETEEKKTESLDEHQIPSTITEEEEDAKISLSDEQPASSIPEEAQVLSAVPSSDISTRELPQPGETQSGEQSTLETTSETAEFVQQQTGLLTNVPNDEPVTEETTQTSADVASNKKTGKHVTWDETVVDNEDDESSSHQSITEESSVPEAPITTTPEDNNTTATIEKDHITTDESKPAIDQQLTSSNITESQITSDQTISPPPSIEPQESQLSLNEQQIHSTSPTDTQLVSITDSSKEDTFTVDEVSTTTSDVISNQDISKSTEESELIKTESKEEVRTDEPEVETSSQVAENAPHESETSVIERTTPSLQPTIVSPIDTLADTVANRYISSDVYHSYLGEHKQFLQDVSDTSSDSTTKSLLASLRETITAPITPLIETIQSVVSNMQTTTATQPLKTESETTDHPQDETKLTTAVVTESKEEVSDDKTQIEEDKPTVDTSKDLKTVFESLREAVTAPITAITETIQTAVSNIQSDKQEIPSTSSTEQLATSLEENVSTVEAKSHSDTVSPSDEKIDDQLNKEIEQTQSSLLDSTQEKADTQPFEHSVSANTVSNQTIVSRTESFDSFATDTTILSSSETSSTVTEPENEEEEKQETTQAETTPSDKPSETTPGQKSDENASTETKTTLEAIRDVITHPLATISEKIQSILPTSTSEQSEQIASDTTKSSISTSEETETSQEQQISGTESAAAIEHKPDSAIETGKLESTETKTTFETFRDIITHPLATITEKIQSVISSSTTEEVPSSEQQTSTTTIDQNTDNDVSSTVTESTFETIQDTITNPSTLVNGTVQDVVSNTTDQTSSFQEKEQILTTQGSELYLQDQIQGEKEISSTTIPSQISDDEKTVQTTESESDRTTNAEIQDSVSHKIDVTTTDTNKILVDTIRDLINDTINTVISDLNRNAIENEQINQESFSSDTSLTSPKTNLNVEDRFESSHPTINQETSINEEDFTWTNLVGKKSSDEKLNQLLEEVVQSSDNITDEITEDKTTNTLPNQTQSLPIIEDAITTPQIDDAMQRSSNELESDSTSAVTEIEKVSSKPSTDFREPSPVNIEDDSLELIHALHGHSIILPSSSQTQTTTTQPSISTSTIEKTDEQVLQAPERSSSSTTTTSSQITSSDRYVSYAIHEMGDSSQERLPAFPVAADMPLYELVQTTSEENKEQQILSEPIVNVNQINTKDDDLTELDATENLTFYSDDNHVQKLDISARNRQEDLDASSTDEDVDDENFNEFEQHDISNLHRIIGEITQQNNNLSESSGQTYQRYDLSSNSSTSTKPQTDDIYIIPGYPGLWRPSADDDSTHSPITTDADDEDEKKRSATTVKTKTIVRTTDPAKLQTFLQQHQDIPLRPDTTDIFNRPLNEFSFDISESDSFKSCPSTINSLSVSKQQKQSELFEIPITEQQEYQTSPDEKIFLIRERERGVSLPVTMKIDCDDMALRLSASTPIDTQLFSTTQTDLPSPSTHSEPMIKTTSSSRASTPSLSGNEGEQQKLPSSSWLNTINTITTTAEGPEGPLESRTTIQKSAKGPISIAECDAQGKYILIENTSRSKSIALANWKIRQEIDGGDTLTFTFPDNCLLRPNHSIKILTRSNESERRNGDLIASSLSSWHTGSNVVTTLINADGKDRASLTKKTLFS